MKRIIAVTFLLLLLGASQGFGKVLNSELFCGDGGPKDKGTVEITDFDI